MTLAYLNAPQLATEDEQRETKAKRETAVSVRCCWFDGVTVPSLRDSEERLQLRAGASGKREMDGWMESRKQVDMLPPFFKNDFHFMAAEFSAPLFFFLSLCDDGMWGRSWGGSSSVSRRSRVL